MEIKSFSDLGIRAGGLANTETPNSASKLWNGVQKLLEAHFVKVTNSMLTTWRFTSQVPTETRAFEISGMKTFDQIISVNAHFTVQNENSPYSSTYREPDNSGLLGL